MHQSLFVWLDFQAFPLFFAKLKSSWCMRRLWRSEEQKKLSMMVHGYMCTKQQLWCEEVDYRPVQRFRQQHARRKIVRVSLWSAVAWSERIEQSHKSQGAVTIGYHWFSQELAVEIWLLWLEMVTSWPFGGESRAVTSTSASKAMLGCGRDEILWTRVSLKRSPTYIDMYALCVIDGPKTHVFALKH